MPLLIALNFLIQLLFVDPRLPVGRAPVLGVRDPCVPGRWLPRVCRIRGFPAHAGGKRCTQKSARDRQGVRSGERIAREGERARPLAAASIIASRSPRNASPPSCPTKRQDSIAAVSWERTRTTRISCSVSRARWSSKARTMKPRTRSHGCVPRILATSPNEARLLHARVLEARGETATALAEYRELVLRLCRTRSKVPVRTAAPAAWSCESGAHGVRRNRCASEAHFLTDRVRSGVGCRSPAGT